MVKPKLKNNFVFLFTNNVKFNKTNLDIKKEYVKQNNVLIKGKARM